ncbi:menaquinol-cytochrome c reductase iron-sulfur subunit [Microlunatus phosphovorus NM-1]|uniref:Cytochrome bc1 complex Rieske iron-sulfur subunit n=1 Tax=Microlunatus phosphovorus (strain ATCC 700054 / DSM 10555 / JCM 9379 / NBRC 101784 / NCIMB 13414 / VKM Ac-1990 / NM-1) TaxID=1032480 RepID=F5XRY8_MICPN|nr:Rieske 2Fe-2S domain-containing protein [Microlunatus phosphovorus]BAK37201.1 menaquinol-cytochrome c reductase iron-sulfur subunit [Microlunatus phosphovorus NM-1]
MSDLQRHGATDHELATVDSERFPVPDPGEPEHLPRLTDIDEAAANRATRQVATMFGLVPILALIFVVCYFAVPKDVVVDFGPLHTPAQHVIFGLTLGLALLLIGTGAIQWARQLMDDHEMVDHRHGAASSNEDREYVITELEKGIDESGITRRKVLGASLLGALGLVALPGVVLLADLGPWPTRKFLERTLETTIWKEGIRLVNDVTYTPIKAEQVQIGQLINAQPENLQDFHGTEFLQEKAKASIIVVRMNPNTIKIPESRKDWHVGGILCYSKICTHVGCPISLWEQQTHHLLCPCHQSTFDLGDSGLVVFGPAARALPQLPITVDAEGYLVARDGFDVPTGPSYFERDSRNDFKRGDN